MIPEEFAEDVVEQEPVESPEPQQEARSPEIDIGRYIEPLQNEVASLRQQLDPQRNAEIFRQQQMVQQHQQRLRDLRLASEQGNHDEAWKHIPYFITTVDQALAQLYKQQNDFAAYREEVQQRFELDSQAMAEERYFAARDPEGHGYLQEYPLHVAKAIAFNEGREKPNQQDVQAAMQHMESRFAFHGNVQDAMDEMANYVRQVKGAATPRQQPRRIPTAVPAVAPQSRETTQPSPLRAVLAG